MPQQIERPQKSQKVSYSGKKKRPTFKDEIRITPKGLIVHVSKSSPHDLTLHNSEPPLPNACVRRFWVSRSRQETQTNGLAL